MHANRLMPNVYRKKLLAFTIKRRRTYGAPAPHQSAAGCDGIEPLHGTASKCLIAPSPLSAIGTP